MHLVFWLPAINVGNNGKAGVVVIQFLGPQFFKRKSKIDGHDGEAISFALNDNFAIGPRVPQHFPPAVRCGPPEIKAYLVKAKEASGVREDYTARLYHAKNIPEAELEFAEVLKSAWKQDAVIGFRRQNTFAVGKIAKKRRFRRWRNVHAMNRSKVMTIPARVYIPIDFQDIARNVGTVPREEPINIIAINRCTTVPPKVI